jgi:F0F1-type ATP synthase membrane subunit c/vacuolar-type H+-ATPase subunit K
MAFDPDQFLQDTNQHVQPAPSGGGFDPDAFLASTAPPQTMKDKLIGMAKTAAPIATKAAGYAMNPQAAVTDAAKWVTENPRDAYQKGGKFLPAAGAAMGSFVAPGIGTAIGAGAGEIARQGLGVAFQDPDVMKHITPGQVSPWAGAQAAMQTGLAGANEVNGLIKAAPGVAPYVDRAVNAASNALAPVGAMAKRGIAKFTETMTGVPARQAVKLIDEPGRLVSGIGQLDSLGQNVTAAESVSEAGLPPAMRAKITTNQDGAADKIVSALLEKKYTNPEAITPLEATAGIKAIDATMPNFTARNGKIVQEYSDLRSTLSKIQASADPNLAAAKGAYNDAKVGADFRNVFRQTKTGATSAVPFLSALVNPAHWGEVAAKLPAFSPAVYGTGLAAGSTALKAAGAVISNPTARQTLISRYVTGKSAGGGGTNDL